MSAQAEYQILEIVFMELSARTSMGTQSNGLTVELDEIGMSKTVENHIPYHY